MFITGSTGFLGREFLKRAADSTLLDADLNSEDKLSLLIRPSRGEGATSRGENLLSEVYGSARADKLGDRFRFIEGDLREEYFGLGREEFSQLALETRSILHCGASVELNQNSSSAQEHNISGTKHVLDLARESKKRNGSFGCFYHVSTAYVAGDTESTVTASELRLHGPFRNHYERSKAEAEALVRDAEREFPICIFRPSVVVGNSVTGQTSSFNVIYVPARMFVSGILRVFPALPSAPFDVVPVDYVASSMVKLMELRERRESCYHLCAGVGRETSPLELLECLIATVEKYRKAGSLPKPLWLAPEALGLLYSALCSALTHVKNLEKPLKVIERLLADHWETIQHVLPFVPYMIRNPRFCVAGTEREVGILAPLFPTYGERLFKYCLDTNWGKRGLALA